MPPLPQDRKDKKKSKKAAVPPPCPLPSPSAGAWPGVLSQWTEGVGCLAGSTRVCLARPIVTEGGHVKPLLAEGQRGHSTALCPGIPHLLPETGQGPLQPLSEGRRGEVATETGLRWEKRGHKGREGTSLKRGTGPQWPERGKAKEVPGKLLEGGGNQPYGHKAQGGERLAMEGQGGSPARWPRT